MSTIYDIESVVISVLETLPDLAEGTNLFEGPVRPISEQGVVPATAVFVIASGGPDPIHYQDGSDATASYREARVQVFVRSKPKAYGTGKSLSRRAYKQLEKAQPTGVIGIRAAQAAPIYVGQEEDGSDIWSLNFVVHQRS